jgi:hypothetical protein
MDTKDLIGAILAGIVGDAHPLAMLALASKWVWAHILIAAAICIRARWQLTVDAIEIVVASVLALISVVAMLEWF